MLDNGLITVDKIKGVPVVVDLIPTTNTTSRPQNPMNPTSITIHETGNFNDGADAKAHTQYVDNATERYVSWHFTVDEDIIYQELPINENAWHSGDGGQGEGNRTSIAIEMCVNKDGDFEKVKENTRKLVQYLMKETGVKEIVPHQHWKSKKYPKGKFCPYTILKNEGWNNFLNFLHVDIDKDEEYGIIKNERDYYKEKFEQLYQFVIQIKEFGGE